MDIIKVGLDFGTHQTKICIKTYPNEDYNHPIFEFFKFKDLEGNDTYFLPSIVQINKDDTLSYGFLDITNRKESEFDEKPRKTKQENQEDINFDIAKKAARLYCQYATQKNTYDDIDVLVKMLSIYKEQKQKEGALDVYSQDKDLDIPTDSQFLFRYFKQATFSERKWSHKISSEVISVWFLSYVIFLLEEKYGTHFSINMGIPVGEKSYKEKREFATAVLVSAYHLVEDVYHNDLENFLNEKVDNLLKKTTLSLFSEDDKEDFEIQIYPEAFAGLTTLTSLGKLSNGMSLITDIGGGTTDISFFTIIDNKPVIYRYWSIPQGLNYIAEKSGFTYKKGLIKQCAIQEVIQEFVKNEKIIIAQLIDDLIRHWTKETHKDKGRLLNALNNRIIVYNGGGSIEEDLVQKLHYFNDIKLVDANMWKETNLKERSKVVPLCQLLTTAYGLSIGESDIDEVKVSKFTTLFNHIGADINEEDTEEIEFTDKDKC